MSALATPAIAPAFLPPSSRAFLRVTQDAVSTILQLETRESVGRKRESAVVNVKRAGRVTLCRVVFYALHSRPSFRIIRHFLPAASHTADIKIQLPLEKGGMPSLPHLSSLGTSWPISKSKERILSPPRIRFPNTFQDFFLQSVHRGPRPACNMGSAKSSIPVCSLHVCI